MITKEEVENTINKLKNHKAAGPSGLGPKHLKYMMGFNNTFASSICNLYNHLLTHPEEMHRIKKLYEFRAVFIPKKGDKFRPIAIMETILLVFHKILTERLRKQTTIHKM
jgi:hypothetical protein